MLTITNNAAVDGIIRSCDEIISALESEIANVEVNIQKLIDEAKASLQNQLDEAIKQKAFWTAIKGGVPVEPEKKTRKTRTRKTAIEEPVGDFSAGEEEETVVDPYENEESVDTAPEEVQDTVQEESTEPDAPISEQEQNLNELWGEGEQTLDETPAEEEHHEPIVQDIEGFDSMPMEW